MQRRWADRLRSADRKKPGVEALRVRQNLLVVFGAEQKDDALPGLFNRSNGPVKLVKTSEIGQQIARELREIDATNRQTASRARSVYGRRLGDWVDNGGHEKPSKSTCRFRRGSSPPHPWYDSNASEDSGVKETPVFFIDSFYHN